MIHNSKQLVASAVTTIGAAGILINQGLFGGYPGGRHRNIAILNPNISELAAQSKPLVHEVGHPSRPSWKGRFDDEVHVYDHLMAPFMVKNGDIFMNHLPSSGGLGDPIERELASVKSDLENGFTTQEIAREVYCVEASYDTVTKEWQIDQAKTRELREARRKQRLARGTPVRQWWQSARQRLLSADIHPLLQEMYQNSMKLSQPFADEFTAFWGLPDDFSL